MISLMQASLLVLAGGDSRRMGHPKAWLKVGGTTLLRYVVDRLAPTFSEVMVSFAEPEQIQEHVKRSIAPYKYPRRIEFVTALPKTTSGKLKRRELRELERARMSGE